MAEMKNTTIRGGIVYDTSLICGDPNGNAIFNYIPIRLATIEEMKEEIDDENKTNR